MVSKWFVFTMDCMLASEYPDGGYPTKREAVSVVTGNHLDGRRRPVVKHTSDGLYTYQPHRYANDHSEVYIVRADALERHGFETHEADTCAGEDDDE